MPTLLSGDLAHLIFALWKLAHAYKHLQPSNQTLALIGVGTLVAIGVVVWWELSRANAESTTDASRPVEPARVPNCGRHGPSVS